MNKSEVIAAIASELNISKAEAARCLDAFLNVIKSAASRGEAVNITGFGKFSVKQRAARKGKNPQTGAVINIPATYALKFVPGKETKLAVQKRSVNA